MPGCGRRRDDDGITVAGDPEIYAHARVALDQPLRSGELSAARRQVRGSLEDERARLGLRGLAAPPVGGVGELHFTFGLPLAICSSILRPSLVGLMMILGNTRGEHCQLGRL